jgi:hypothetical protein
MGTSDDCSRQSLNLIDVNMDGYPEIVATSSEYKLTMELDSKNPVILVPSVYHSRDWLLVLGARDKVGTRYLLYEDSEKTASSSHATTKWISTDYNSDNWTDFVAMEFLGGQVAKSYAWSIRCIRWKGNSFVEDVPFPGLIKVCHPTDNPKVIQPPEDNLVSVPQLSADEYSIRFYLVAIQLFSGDYSFVCMIKVAVSCTPQNERKPGSNLDIALTRWEHGVRVVNIDKFMFYDWRDGTAWNIYNTGEDNVVSDINKVILTTDASASTYVPISGEWTPCFGEPPSKIHPTMQAFFSSNLSTATLYDLPFNLASNSEVGQGQYVDIIGGPACPGEGGTWWKIKLTVSGKEGWTRENGFDEWLDPQ